MGADPSGAVVRAARYKTGAEKPFVAAKKYLPRRARTNRAPTHWIRIERFSLREKRKESNPPAIHLTWLEFVEVRADASESQNPHP